MTNISKISNSSADIQDGITESESYSPDWKSIRVAAAVIVAAILAVVGVVLYAS